MQVYSTSVRLQKDLLIPLDQLCKQLDRSRNYLINSAIREFLAQHACPTINNTATKTDSSITDSKPSAPYN